MNTMKILPAVALAALLLNGCAASGENLGIGQSLAASMLNNECHRYLEEQQLWQVAKLTLGSKGEEAKSKVCGCASEEAARNMTAQQMIGLANESTRTKVLVEMIAPTVKTCYVKLKDVL